MYYPYLLPSLRSNFYCLIQLIGPYALGVLPKANFFAELVQSMDDNPVKPSESTANSSPALPMTQPKNSYKVKETGTGTVSYHLCIFCFYFDMGCDDASLPLSCFCGNS